MTECIIMCAGRGLRLMPLTVDRPKAMVNVKGRPIIHWLMDALSKLEIDNIYVIIGYKGGKLKSYLKYNFPNKNIVFIHQKARTGTADAIYLAKEFIKDDFIVVSGDIIYEYTDLEKLMYHINSLLYTTQDARLYEYGTLDIKETMDLDGGMKIGFINEKSSRPTSNFINCGAYHFSIDIFKFIKETPYDSRFNEKIITNTINLMIDSGTLFRGIYIKQLNEITYPEDVEKIGNRLE